MHFCTGERHLITPASLPLIIDSKKKSLRIESVLRLLPGKRLVVKAALDNRMVIVKLFVRSLSSKRHIDRERAGYEIVMGAGIRCAKLLHTTSTTCNRFEGVIYECIDAPALSICWPRFDAEKKQLWLKRITRTMLALHQVGAFQSDIHADNFLLKNDELYLLDLGSIVIASAPLSRQQSIANLGALIAQFTFYERKLFSTAIADYCNQRNWDRHTIFEKELHAAIDKCWQDRKHDYLRKALRECKLTAFSQTFKRIQAIRRDWIGDDLSQLCADPDAAMAAGTLLKAGNTATVVKATLNGKQVIIKRYNIKNWRHGLSRALRPTRAQHSWLYAHWLELAGIESMKPIALIERRLGFWRRTAYFIGTWLDAPDLLATGQQRELSHEELQHLQMLLEAMQDARLSHGDFKANNLLLCKGGVALIDLDAMHEHSSEHSWRKAFARDLARLLRNWLPDRKIYQQVKHLTEQVLP